MIEGETFIKPATTQLTSMNTIRQLTSMPEDMKKKPLSRRRLL
jgi:hypothetical protein